MSKSFRDWNVDQPWLLPPSINDFVPAGHVAHCVRETVREGLDLRLITLSYKGERGQPPFHPALTKTVEEWMSQASGADGADDRTHGPVRRGDETPSWMASKQSRLATGRVATHYLRH